MANRIKTRIVSWLKQAGESVKRSRNTSYKELYKELHRETEAYLKHAIIETEQENE